MRSDFCNTFDLFAILVDEWIPLDVKRGETSADARLIFLGMLAIAEQLKNARSDHDETILAIGFENSEVHYDRFANCTDADFEEMARQDRQERNGNVNNDRDDADPELWTDEALQDREGTSDEL